MMRSSSLLLLLASPAFAVMPTGILTLLHSSTETELFVAEANFGSSLPTFGSPLGPLSLLSSASALSAAGLGDGSFSSSLLCDDAGEYSASALSSAVALLIPRGTCSFAIKAKNANTMGAAAVVIYETLSSKYGYNETEAAAGDGTKGAGVEWPRNLNDYDCSRGNGTVSASTITLPYSSAVSANDATTYNSCGSCNFCLLTGHSLDSSGAVLEDLSGSSYQTCCAWDLHQNLYWDGEHQTDTVNVFATMEESKVLLSATSEGDGSATIMLERRWTPSVNVGGVLIWALGVAVAIFASYAAGGDLREGRKKYFAMSSDSAGPPSSASKRTVAEEESMELTVRHAAFFIVNSSCGLLILYFTGAYSFVKVMYAFGCSGAISQLIFYPIVTRIVDATGMNNKLLHESEEWGNIYMSDILAGVFGYTWGGIWLYVAFAIPHPDSIPFFWITQDVFGACLCTVFLSTIRLPNLKVAAALLGAAFFYDIFFVFITPYIFKSSIMLTVATSGGPPPDALWCEKYPNDSPCLTGDPMPMLFSIPNWGDYQGGSSLLGLGDIVLPGLLLALCARMDEARALLGAVADGRGGGVSLPRLGAKSICCEAYFAPVCVAYAVGLCMAFIAVLVMQMGQPALLYLVPCTVGTVAFVGWRRGELSDLWNGPRFLDSAQKLLDGYEEDQSSKFLDESDGEQSATSQDAMLNSPDHEII